VKKYTLLFLSFLLTSAIVSATVKELVEQKLNADYPYLEAYYKDLHAHPELSFMEVNTAAKLAGELRGLGFDVTEHVGGTGVVAVLKNGPGPTLLIRADMDALPVKELTGLPYASTEIVKDISGKMQPAMHACSHDTHVTILIGTARQLVALKDRWSGTLVLIGQPAEEIVSGARAMLADGLLTRFPRPDMAIALHTIAGIPTGSIRYTEGVTTAASFSVDIMVHGVGGHGSAPQNTKDPVLLGAEIVVALQSIVSREIEPGQAAVVTVGSFHGGRKRNIIDDEAKLELTVRAFDENVGEHLIAAIKRIAENMGRVAGLPDDRLPTVTVLPETAPVTYNDPALTRKVVGAMAAWLGDDKVKSQKPLTGSEDFSEFGRTTPKIPICIILSGGTDPAVVAEHEKTGKAIPPNHSPLYAPPPEASLKTGVLAMTAASLDLLAKK
jgi:hippurate hydrolase